MAITLQDKVYFGTVWFVYATDQERPPLPLGGGFSNARTVETPDGAFFAGIVEKVGANGRVSDVVLTFAGAEGVDDLLTGYALQYGLPSDQSTLAASTYQEILDDPRYADATVHVMGHSLGAGLTQYVLGYSLATHGDAFTRAHADFTGFGVPAHGEGVARSFGLELSQFDGLFTGYTASNDPVAFPPSEGRIGVNYVLDAYQPFGEAGLILNGVAAHMQPTFIAALGLPAWLGSEAPEVASYVQSQQILPADPDYGPPGHVDLAIVGDAANNVLIGMAGDDQIAGKGGRDVLTGGAGADLFVFTAPNDSGAIVATADRITDFSHSEGDRIDLSAIAAGLGLLGGALDWIGGSPVFTAPNQVRTYWSGGNTYVAVNLDADQQPETLIRVDGLQLLQQSDFNLVHVGPPISIGPILDLLGLG